MTEPIKEVGDDGEEPMKLEEEMRDDGDDRDDGADERSWTSASVGRRNRGRTIGVNRGQLLVLILPRKGLN